MENFVAVQFGVAEHIQKLQRYLEAGEVAAENAVIEAADLVLELSLELCPIDTGHLRSTGQVIIDGDGYATVATVGYSADYAIYVHENLEAHHKPPTQAKFLSDVYRRFRGDITRTIKKAVQNAIEKAKRKMRQIRSKSRYRK